MLNAPIKLLHNKDILNMSQIQKDGIPSNRFFEVLIFMEEQVEGSRMEGWKPISDPWNVWGKV